MSADTSALNGSTPEGLRTRGVDMRRVRPLRWLWERRIPVGLPSLLVGEESVGKGNTRGVADRPRDQR